MIQHFVDGGASIFGSDGPVVGCHIVVLFLERVLAILIVIRYSFRPSRRESDLGV